ncbi:hypothetical protein TrRE_jg8476 [Triparma retinervis]|uniref:Uncharacterized protein n=1 Tax=Triparma retinervis TaxID=2557542 RepID=A0A9W6ZTZ7_9STRA|nr:hypothetical protein TrRE_jg8476 [Triparma retinervis]
MHQYPQAYPQAPAQHLQQHQYPPNHHQHQSSPRVTPAIHTKEDRDLGSILLGFMNTVRHNHPIPPSPPASTTVTSSDISDTNSSSDSDSYPHPHHHQHQQHHHQAQHAISGDSGTSGDPSASAVVNDENCNASFTSSNVALHTKTLDEEFKHQPSLPPQSAVTSVSGEGELEGDIGAGDRSTAVSELDDEGLGTVKVHL